MAAADDAGTVPGPAAADGHAPGSARASRPDVSRARCPPGTWQGSVPWHVWRDGWIGRDDARARARRRHVVRARARVRRGRATRAGTPRRRSGTRCATARAGAPSSTPTTWPRRRARRSTRRAARLEGPIAAVGASCFWHSLLAVDGRGRALTPVLTWRDTRSVDDADALAAPARRRTPCTHAPAAICTRATGRRSSPGCAAPTRTRSARRAPLRLLLRLPLRPPRRRRAHEPLDGLGHRPARRERRRAGTTELLEALELDPDRLPEISDEPIGDGASPGTRRSATAPARTSAPAARRAAAAR